jgi:hypothetical protein
LAKLPAKIVDDDRESPDFLLEFDGRIVGLEVTQLFVPDHPGASRPADESAIDEIVDRARQSYLEAGGKMLQVRFAFFSREGFAGVRRVDAANAIADFLLHMDTPLEGTWQYDRRVMGFDRLPPQLVSITAWADPTNMFPHWTASKAGWVSPLDTAAVQPSVDEKASRIARYREVAPEVWLLLAIEGRRASQFFELRADPPTIRSPFDRTYLYLGFEGAVHLLPATGDAECA